MTRARPTTVLGLGVTLTIVAGMLIGGGMALGSDDPAFSYFFLPGLVVGVFAGPVLVVGLIAYAVQIGVQAAHRQ